MTIYLLGYRDRCNIFSWSDGFFDKPIPLDEMMSRKQVMEFGYNPFYNIGPKQIEPCDYYIAREFKEQ